MMLAREVLGTGAVCAPAAYIFPYLMILCGAGGVRFSLSTVRVYIYILSVARETPAHATSGVSPRKQC